MKSILFRAVVVAFLIVVIGAAGLTLTAKPLHNKKWYKCPTPTCNGACDPDEFPNFLCRTKDRVYYESSYECCCCVEGGDRNRYKGLY